MPRFFIDESSLCGENIIVRGGDAVHIGRSLRMKTGDMLTFCREGMEYECEIERITAEEVYCRIISSAQSSCEPDLRLTVYQALPKNDKPELIIQKCTELGASEFVFFISSRCVSRPDEKSAAKKLVRWQKIAEEAAKQSGRGNIPIVRGIISLKDAVSELAEKDMSLLCYENGGKRLSEIDFSGVHTCGIMIGAEGGFDKTEADSVCEGGAVPVWLGERILRCETCPIAMTAVIMNITGNF